MSSSSSLGRGFRPRRLLAAGAAVLVALALAGCTLPELQAGSPNETVSVIATPGATQSPTPTVTPINVQVVAAPPVAEDENPDPVDGELRFTRGQWATVLGVDGEPVGRFTVTGLVTDVHCLEEDAPKAEGRYVAIQLRVEGYGALTSQPYDGEFAPVFGFNRLELYEKNSDTRFGESLAYDCIESSVQQREYGVGAESGYFVFDAPKGDFDVVWEYGEQRFRFVNLT